MAQYKTIKLLLSPGTKIPRLIRYLVNATIGYERVYGRRIRFIKFRRAEFINFGRGGVVWLKLPEFIGGFSHFRNTLRVVDARGRVIGQNIFLCPNCFTLSGKLLGEASQDKEYPHRVRSRFACGNDGCNEQWKWVW